MCFLWTYSQYTCILPVINFCIPVFPNLDHIHPAASLSSQRQAALDLIGRILGPKSEIFHVDIVPNNDPELRDTFTVSSLL